MPQESQWVTFRAGKETYGFEITRVREMQRLPPVHALPEAPHDALGVILLRDRVIPVVDLCATFGLESRAQHTEQLVELLTARLADHEHWVSELEHAVDENREFTLTLDPHACKFGRWYDSFQTDDPWLAGQLRHFDEPHKRIHALGAEIVGYQQAGDCTHCRERIQTGRDTTFRELTALFGETMLMVKDHGQQSVIIVGAGAQTLGIAVDEIQSVVRCRSDEIQPPDVLPNAEDHPEVIGLLPQKGREGLAILIDPCALYPQLNDEVATADEA
jgi:purine-binding chemotaxis protein CheW